MPSPNAFSGTPRTQPVHLRRVNKIADVDIFVRARTGGTHQLGTDCRAVYRRLTTKGRHAFVIENGIGAQLGCCSLTEAEPGIAVVGIAMLPSYRGTGAASIAMGLIEKEAAQLGFFALRADIFDDNVNAQSFFERKGFRSYSMFEKPVG